MGLLDFIFDAIEEESEIVRRERDTARGFADGVAEGQYEEEHPIASGFSKALGDQLDGLESNEYRETKRAGYEFFRRNIRK